MDRGVRVFVSILATAPEEGAVERAYHSISRELRGTPGLRGNELLRSLTEPRTFIVLSYWASLAAFQEWESGSSHRSTTAPLRPYRRRGDGPGFGIYEVWASY